MKIWEEIINMNQSGANHGAIFLGSVGKSLI